MCVTFLHHGLVIKVRFFHITQPEREISSPTDDFFSTDVQIPKTVHLTTPPLVRHWLKNLNKTISCPESLQMAAWQTTSHSAQACFLFERDHFALQKHGISCGKEQYGLGF